jgi:AhpD family alkylhydroperoxidase
MGKTKWNRIAATLTFAAVAVTVGAIAAGNKKTAAVGDGQAGLAQAKPMPPVSTSAGNTHNSAEAAAARSDIAKTLGFVPKFLGDMPDALLPGLWDQFKNLQLNANTALPKSTKELIGLGVAAQIPCTYCIEAHGEFAKLGGATDRELGEALAVAAVTRHWSAFMYGIQADPEKFRGEIRNAIAFMKKGAAAKGAPAGTGAAGPKGTGTAAGTTPLDGQGALKEATQVYGFAPVFMKRFPEVARAGAWRTLKDVEMGPTSLSAKHKALIELGVAAQIPCTYCVLYSTEFAKMQGATEAELTEAVAIASFTREMSTMLNGMRTDAAQFSADVSRLVKSSQAAANPAESGTPR